MVVERLWEEGMIGRKLSIDELFVSVSYSAVMLTLIG